MPTQQFAAAAHHAPSSVWSELVALAAALPVAIFMDALKNPVAASQRAPASNARSQR